MTINIHDQMHRRTIQFIGSALILAGFVACSRISNDGMENAPRLWQPIESSVQLPRSPETIRSIPIKVNNRGLIKSSGNKRFLMPLPDGGSLTVVKEWQERVGDNAFVWHGKVKGDADSFVTLTVVNKSLMGTILSSTGNIYRLTQANGTDFFEEVDPSKIVPVTIDKVPHPVDVRDIVTQPLPPSVFMTCPNMNATRIDIMVLYTQKALEGAGGEDRIVGAVGQGIGETNESFCSSDVNLQLNLVHLAEVSDSSFTDAGPPDTAKLALHNNTIKDTNGETVGELRDKWKADLVVLLVETTGFSAGDSDQFNGNPDKAFSVVVRQYATGDSGAYSFAHEVGHLLGANHDRADTDTGNTGANDSGFNHGHVQFSTSSSHVAFLHGQGFNWFPWRTIMATSISCQNCARILLWSNPAVKFQGDATGVPLVTDKGGVIEHLLAEDNHYMLNLDGPVVAGFR